MTGPGGLPIQAPVTTIKAGEPKVILTIKKHKVSLLINTGASISDIPFSSRPRFSKKITVRSKSGQSLECYFTQPLACSWGEFPFLSLLSNCPRNPYPFARVRPSI
jgi:hypothetical protein